MDISVFQSFPLLHTNRLTLGPLRGHDRVALEEVFSFQGASKKLLSVDEMLIKLDTAFEAKKGVNWGVILDGELIGTCGYYRGFDNQVGEIGYVMRKAYRRKGYLKEAAQAIIQFGFTQLELACITAYTTDDNVASRKVLVNLGFTYTESTEGKYRRYELLKAKENL